MTPEIKQRIEQIRRGEEPEGYQYTRYGIYPISWVVKRVGDCIEEYRELSNDIQSFPVYSSSRKGLMPQSEYYDQKKAKETNLGYKIVPNGYVTYRHMSDDDVFHFNINHTGNDILVSSEYPVFTSVNGTDLGFLIPALNYTARFRYFCRTQKLGGTRTRLYLNNLSQYRLGVPSFKEQQKIAAILTTQDEVIELKEKRLAEKLRQKKYLMQQLLTGKKRLPGFSGQWEIKGFNQVFTFGATNTFSRECMCEDSTGVKNIHYGDILVRYGEVLKLSEQEIPSLLSDIGAKITTFVDDGDVVIADTAEDLTAGKVVEVQETHGKKVAAGLHTMLCKPIKGCFAPGWLGYYMNSETYHKQLVPYITGVKVMSISKGNIVKTHILVPPIEEQTAIVKVFSTTDREIDLLRQDIEQEKQKKKALMQMLLTGIVRVNV